MTAEYVRSTYRVPAKRGGRVEYRLERGGVLRGVITSATHYVRIRFDGETRSRTLHPKEHGLVYLDGEAKP